MEKDNDTSWFTYTILNSIDGFFDWTLGSGHIVLSLSLKQLLGHTKEAFTGDNKHFFSENVHFDDRDRLLKEISNFFKSHRERLGTECRLKKKTGDYIWVKIQGRISRDEQGKPKRFAAIVIDIHDYRRNISETREVSEAKSKFIASFNHEFRSPLTSIKGAGELILQEPLSDKQKRYTNSIIQASDFLLKLVNDILDISKIEAGKLELEKAPFILNNILNNTLEMVKENATQKGLSLLLNTSDHLPPLIIGDSTRLQQIILNFLSNAVKFTQKGTITTSTRFTPLNDLKGKLYIEVVDPGIGIPSERINHLFQDFTQADTSTSRLYGGTGLGLSICKKLVGLMGGQIGVKSKENIGSTFWFEITVETAHSTKMETQKSIPVLQENKRLKILVVEDNEVNQQVMLGLLERMGHDVAIAENGEIGVKSVQNNAFDLVFMDINMPVKGGIEACQDIRKFNKKIPIIAITANGLESEKKRCLEAGMNHFSTKPVDRQKLTELLMPYQNTYTDFIRSSEDVHTATDENPAEATRGEHINTDGLLQLQADLGEAKIIKLLNLYKQDAPGLITNLEKGIDLERSAHTLAGMSENLSFSSLSKQSRTILQMIREEDGDNQIHILIQSLPKLYDRTMKEIDTVISQ